MNPLKQYVSYFIIVILVFYGCRNKMENIAISSDGVKISFDNKGQGQPAVIFIHGWANKRSIWNEQIEYFAKKYQVVAVDLAGFGTSGNGRIKWTMSAFGDDVIAVIDDLNLKQVVLVGFSLGGPVAIEAANKIPGKVAGVVLVDNLQDVEMKYLPESFDYLDSVMMDLVTYPTPEKIEGIFYKKNPDASFKRVVKMLQGGPGKGWRESLHENIRWNNEDRDIALRKLRVPVIAINSDREPTNVQAFRNFVPSFEVMIISETGHLIFWDNADEFNRLLEESIQRFVKNKK